MSADFRSVRKILWEDWDPIGCGVRVTAAETMGCPVSDEKLGHVADALLALGQPAGGMRS